MFPWNRRRAAYTAVMPRFLPRDKGKPVARTGAETASKTSTVSIACSWSPGSGGSPLSVLVQGCRVGALRESHYFSTRHSVHTPHHRKTSLRQKQSLLFSKTKGNKQPHPHLNLKIQPMSHFTRDPSLPVPRHLSGMKGPIWDIDSTSKRSLCTSRNHRQWLSITRVRPGG